MNWLLVFVPICLALHWFWPDRQTAIFFTSCLAIIPVAGWLSEATEHLANRAGDGIGGLLNATFGNAAELIIGFAAMRKGLHEVVKASLSGSVIGNLLLVLGASILTGGIGRPFQTFNEVAARSQSSSLLLAAVAFVMPAAYHHLARRLGNPKLADLSVVISVVLLIVYGLSLLFSLRTHKRLFLGPPKDEAREVKDGGTWSASKSLLVLAASTALIAVLSEVLVGSVEAAAKAVGMTSIFVGVIVVAIVGNAAEHTTAIVMARKDRMDLSIGIATGSSIQVALFVAPALVLLSHLFGPAPMDLVFTPAEVLAVFMACLVTSQVTGDGESNWLEGVQLLAVYVMVAIVFFFLPEQP